MASTLEAIFGAVYLDSGMKSVTQVMRNLSIMPTLVRRTQTSKGGRFQEALAQQEEELRAVTKDSEELNEMQKAVLSRLEARN